MTLYAELMQSTGKSYMIENCHWGQCWDIDGDPDANSCPTTDWCPFNMFVVIILHCVFVRACVCAIYIYSKYLLFIYTL